MAKAKPGRGAKSHLKSQSKPHPKSHPKSQRPPKRSGDRAASPAERRQRTVSVGAEPPQRKRPSDAMHLAAEVERLQRELASAHSRMAELAACAEIDPLTEVLNRRGFERELGRSLAYVKRHGTSAALLYLDLDDFKSVNDRHGHAAGDAVLKAVASVLRRHTRASDLVARLGGDEFAVLLWNCDEPNAHAKAAALEAAIARTTATHGGTAVSAAASVGAAMLLPLDRPAEAIDRADRAMYARKGYARKSCRNGASSH